MEAGLAEYISDKTAVGFNMEDFHEEDALPAKGEEEENDVDEDINSRANDSIKTGLNSNTEPECDFNNSSGALSIPMDRSEDGEGNEAPQPPPAAAAVNYGDCIPDVTQNEKTESARDLPSLWSIDKEENVPEPQCSVVELQPLQLPTGMPSASLVEDMSEPEEKRPPQTLNWIQDRSPKLIIRLR